MLDDLVPLHSLEVEMSVLGSMILSPVACEDLCEKMDPADFYRPAHKEIFRALQALVRRQVMVDLVTLKNELVSREKLHEIGGEDYLIQVAEFVPSAANASHYAGIVVDKAILRRLEHAGREIIGAVREVDDLSADEKLDKAESLVAAARGVARGGGSRTMAEMAREFFVAIDEAIESGERKTGLSTGLGDLDRKIKGLFPGNLIVVGARPSMGKSAFMLSVALGAAKAKREGAVAIFSLEMTSSEIENRLVSMTAGVDSQLFPAPDLPPEMYRKLADAAEYLLGLNIKVDDRSGLSPLNVRAECRRIRSEHGLAMIVLDYLELMRSDAKCENKTIEIGTIAKACKAIAKDFQVPVVLLSQLNRQAENRQERRPMLSDLRQSGEVEAAADVVMLLYRAAYYDQKRDAEDWDPDRCEEAEVIIAKHRNGPTGTVKLGFQPAYSRFCQLARGS